MIAMPAIDLREGACVQLVGGLYSEERVRLEDPVRVARRWIGTGFRCLHVVDLDAATGAGSNAKVIDQLLELDGASLQVGGGLRSTQQVGALVRRGAHAVVGTRALEEPHWLAELAARWPGRVVLALDVKHGHPAVRGWSRTLDATIESVLARVATLPLAALLVTAVDVEGRMQGCDLDLYNRVLRSTALAVIASGGITTIEDVRALAERGVASAVIGMALYTGTLDADDVAAQFSGSETHTT